MASSQNFLKYYPFSSLIETNFWHTFCQKKLEEYRLERNRIELIATYRNDLNCSSAFASLDFQSFITDNNLDDNVFPLFGELVICDTIEEFKEINKSDLINSVGQKLWATIQNSKFNDDLDIIRCLNRFIFLLYGDLKKYRFNYWFAFPAVNFPEIELLNRQSLSSVWPQNLIDELCRAYLNLPSTTRTYFIISKTQEISVHSLLDFGKLNTASSDIILAFSDPCSKSDYPGWPLRNLLVYLSCKSSKVTWKILAYRTDRSSCAGSILFDIKLPEKSEITSSEYPGCVGWERNESGKLLPRKVDLGATLDPKIIASNAVDLNLKLMRWRLVPNLDLEKITLTKCLLLGSGTLGCNVARSLLGWGVKHITFVDSGKVSFSNPVRQTLFEFEDCLEGGKFKALAAAERLKKIQPKIQTSGHVLTIPMPGHAVYAADIENTLKDCDKLDRLIEEHDCIFLLMDTRESRWLPTVLGQYRRKLVINTALGFDTFLVQRHGVPPGPKTSLDGAFSSKNNKSSTRLKLGCYFCNDVVAPGNSTQNRSLDQQCTITRPGVSMIAAALAVELMVSVLQLNDNELDRCEDQESILGTIPHQIRGFLSNFTQVMPASYAFDRCVACSPKILEKLEGEGNDFLKQVFENHKFLEDLTDLKELLELTSIDDIVALSDDDSN